MVENYERECGKAQWFIVSTLGIEDLWQKINLNFQKNMNTYLKNC